MRYEEFRDLVALAARVWMVDLYCGFRLSMQFTSSRKGLSGISCSSLKIEAQNPAIFLE